MRINVSPVLVGIDWSTTRSGIAWLTGSQSFQHVGTPGDQSVSDWAWRIMEMADSVVEKACELKADIAVIEEFFLNAKSQSMVLERAGLYWRIICGLQEAGIKCYLVSPSSVKKFLCLDGAAEKESMEHEINALFPWCPVRNHDEADAKAIMCIGYLWHGIRAAEFSEEQIRCCPPAPWEKKPKKKKGPKKPKIVKPKSCKHSKKGVDK